MLKFCINLAEILSMHIPMPRTESLAMPEAVPMRGCVKNLNVYGHINKVSQVPKSMHEY